MRRSISYSSSWSTPWTTEQLVSFAKSEAARAEAGEIKWKTIMNRFYDMRQYCKANNLFPSDPELTGFFTSETVENIRKGANDEKRKGMRRSRPTLPLPSHDNIKTEAAEVKVLEQQVNAEL
jgi:hypothetical protein